MLGLGQGQGPVHGQAQAHGQGQVHRASGQDDPLTHAVAQSAVADLERYQHVNLLGFRGGLVVSDLGSFESLPYVSLGPLG